MFRSTEQLNNVTRGTEPKCWSWYYNFSLSDAHVHSLPTNVCLSSLVSARITNGPFHAQMCLATVFCLANMSFESSFKVSGRTDNLQLATAPTSLGLKLLELLALTVSCLDPKGTVTSLE